MMVPRTLALASFMVFAPLCSAIAAEKCELSRHFLQKDVEKKKKVKTTHLRKVLYDKDVFFFSESMKVNTDGAVRSYHPKDLRGIACEPKPNETITEEQALARGCAMNLICNGAKVHLKGGSVLESGKCPDMLKHIIAIRENDWKSKGGAKIEWIGVEPDGKKIGGPPCIDPANGFFVSTAATRSGLGGPKCEQKKYLDALVPSIVVPKCWTKTHFNNNTTDCKKLLPKGINPQLEPGDLVAVRARSKSPVFAFAVIGDTGPNLKLGEASIGLLMKIKNKPAPRWYKESYALGGEPIFDVVIFRNTKFSKPLTTGNVVEMNKAAQQKLIAWGKDDENRARERIAACAELTAK